jgi:acylphosphatase
MDTPTLFPEVLRAEVYYSGRVQGVGFRFQTRQVAREFDVAGFVRNLDDGRVHLVAEGSADQVNQFLDTLASRMHGFIRKTERANQIVVPNLKGFEIR